MNAVHLHLILNHIPVVGSAIALVLLCYGLVRKEDAVCTAALLLTVLVALFAIPAYWTGDFAENIAEGLDGVSPTAIEAHEERAELAIWVIEISGILAFVSLMLERSAPSDTLIRRILPYAVAVTLLAAAIILATTANLGGRIRHPEIDIARLALR